MARLDAFNDAKFGLMISWGIYSVGGVEASWPLMLPQIWPGSPPDDEYFGWAADFKPTKFDALEWVSIFQKSGARYLVPLTKHHDGFCMFDAPGIDFKSTNPDYAGRDFMAELAAACSILNFPHLGFYYSPPDLHNPDYRDTGLSATANWWSDFVPQAGDRDARFEQYLTTMRAHLHTLLTDPIYRVNGAPVFLMWFDGLMRQWIFEPDTVYAELAALSPDTLINNRLYFPGDFITPENFVPDAIPVQSPFPPPAPEPQSPQMSDALFFDLALGAMNKLTSWLDFYKLFIALQTLETWLSPPWPMPPAAFQPWETCMTMSLSESWSYSPDETFKTPASLIQMLVQAASSGGNFLLNVGPKPDGTIPEEACMTLEAIGTWLAVNGAAIYGSTYGPYRDAMRRLYTTQVGETVYLHVFDAALAVSDGRLELLQFGPAVSAVNPLAGGGTPLPFTQTSDTLSIDVSPMQFDPTDPDTVLALTLQ